MPGIPVANMSQFLDALKRMDGMVFLIVYGGDAECDILYDKARKYADVPDRRGFREVIRIVDPSFMDTASRQKYGLSSGDRGIAAFSRTKAKVIEFGVDAGPFDISRAFSEAEQRG